jgi:hypothetical protein
LFSVACCTGQSPDFLLIQFDKCATLQTPWQNHGAIPDADEATDSMTHCLKHAPDFTVSAFG